MKKGIFLLILLFCPIGVFAADDGLPKATVETFLNEVQQGHISTAYDQLFVGSNIPVDKPQAVTALKQQTQTGLGLYGKALGHELVHEERFGTSIVRYVYILKSEKGPTIWEFYFYKPKSNWFLANVIFNDQFNLLSTKK
jgi:hypothetical protein